MKKQRKRQRLSLTEHLLTHYRSMPESLRIVATACIGAGIGYVTYLLIYFLNPLQPRAATSWFFAFLINVSRQHALHRWLTFNYHGPYWRSLRRAYIMYSGTAAATTTLNWYLTVRFGLNHHLAWLACLGLTASISLMFLKHFVFGREQ